MGLGEWLSRAILGEKESTSIAQIHEQAIQPTDIESIHPYAAADLIRAIQQQQGVITREQLQQIKEIRKNSGAAVEILGEAIPLIKEVARDEAALVRLFTSGKASVARSDLQKYKSNNYLIRSQQQTSNNYEVERIKHLQKLDSITANLNQFAARKNQLRG